MIKDTVYIHPSSRPEIHLRLLQERALHFLMNDLHYTGEIRIKTLGGRIKRPDLTKVPWLQRRTRFWIADMIEAPLDLSRDGDHVFHLNNGQLSRTK